MFFLLPLWIKMWITGAHVLSFRFHVALDPETERFWLLHAWLGVKRLNVNNMAH